MKLINSNILEKLMGNDLAEIGVCDDSVKHVTKCLIQTSLRGVDSHGINLFPHYCRVAKIGRVNKNPQFKFTKSASSAGVLDADHGFGHHSGASAMQHAISMAKNSGIGSVGVTNSTHFSAAAYYGLIAAEHDCLGFAFTNADALVKATGAREAFFGTNPICFTAPMLREEPFCLDMATSQVSWNKIMNYRRINHNIPEQWAFDSSGKATTDPHDATSLSPTGDYKGFGLGFMVDILCATLLGGVQGKDLIPMYREPVDATKRGIGHFFMAIDISKFTETSRFKDNLQNMVDRVRCLAAIDGMTPMVPGDPEKIVSVVRKESGIPIDEFKFEEFLKINSHYADAVMP